MSDETNDAHEAAKRMINDAMKRGPMWSLGVSLGSLYAGVLAETSSRQAAIDICTAYFKATMQGKHG